MPNTKPCTAHRRCIVIGLLTLAAFVLFWLFVTLIPARVKTAEPAGHEKWNHMLKFQGDQRRFDRFSPVVDNDGSTVVVAGGSNLLALDVATDPNNPSEMYNVVGSFLRKSQPRFSKNGSLLYVSNGRFQVLDASNGNPTKLKWHISPEINEKLGEHGLASFFPPSFSSDEATAFVTTISGIPAAIDITNGTVLWALDTCASLENTEPCDRPYWDQDVPKYHGSLNFGPIVFGGPNVYAINPVDGALYAFAAKTGAVSWSSKIGSKIGNHLSPEKEDLRFMREHQPVVSGDMSVVYAGGNHISSDSIFHRHVDGAPPTGTSRLYAVSATDGSEVWHLDIAPVDTRRDNDDCEKDCYWRPCAYLTRPTLSADDSTLYVTSTTVRCSQMSEGDAEAPPSSMSAELLAINAKDGTVKWKKRVGLAPTTVTAPTESNDGTVIYASMNLHCDEDGPSIYDGPACDFGSSEPSKFSGGALLAMNAADGKRLWIFPFSNLQNGAKVSYASKPVVSPDDSTVYLQSFGNGNALNPGSVAQRRLVFAVSTGYALKRGWYQMFVSLFSWKKMTTLLAYIGAVLAAMLCLLVLVRILVKKLQHRKGPNQRYGDVKNDHTAPEEGSEALLGGPPINHSSLNIESPGVVVSV